MHPYFIFKDLVTIFAFFLVLSVLVFFYPNLLGRYFRVWPTPLCLIIHIMVTCAICWKDILFVSVTVGLSTMPINRLNYCLQRPDGFSPLTCTPFWLYLPTPPVEEKLNTGRVWVGAAEAVGTTLHNIKTKELGGLSRQLVGDRACTHTAVEIKTEAKVKIYTKTIIVRGLFIIKIFRKYIITKINPIIVKYYYKIYNQQITKLINKYLINTLVYTFLLLVGISETIRTKINDIKKLKYIIFRAIPTALAKLKVSKKGGAPQLVEAMLSKRQSSKCLGWPRTSLLIGGCGNGKGSKKQIHTKSGLTLQKHKITDKHNNEISLEFKQWFAGLTDGAGFIYVAKGCVGFEIALKSLDEKVLRLLQNKFGGRIHARAGLNAVRYRTQHKDTVYKIIQCLNGLVINNIRLAQLHKACLALNIPILDHQLPDINSAYISGLFDSDGHINIYKSFYSDTYRYQLTITITNKSLCNIEFLTNVIGGKVYFDKGLNGHYKWIANSNLLHLKLYDYFLKFPPKTIKKHRTFLITEFHELNSIKSYLETDKLSVRYKKWQMFLLR